MCYSQSDFSEQLRFNSYFVFAHKNKKASSKIAEIFSTVLTAQFAQKQKGARFI